MEVVLLRHFVMDQMYALLAYTPPLDAKAFSDRGYASQQRWDTKKGSPSCQEPVNNMCRYV